MTVNSDQAAADRKQWRSSDLGHLLSSRHSRNARRPRSGKHVPTDISGLLKRNSFKQHGNTTCGLTFFINRPEMRIATTCGSSHSERWNSRRHLWLVNADSIAARTHGTGGCMYSSRTDAAYVRARAVPSAPKPRHLSFAYKASRSALLKMKRLAISYGHKQSYDTWKNVPKRKACLMIAIT